MDLYVDMGCVDVEYVCELVEFDLFLCGGVVVGLYVGWVCVGKCDEVVVMGVFVEVDYVVMDM